MPKKILFLIASATEICGGAYVILQHASHLQAIGHDVLIATLNTAELPDVQKPEKQWHPALQQLKIISIDEAKNYAVDIAIFTWWGSILAFEKINAKSYVYFVQSIESRFYPENDQFMRDAAERTYQLNLPVITEAKWIQEYLERNHHNRCELVRNGIIKTLYTETGDALSPRPKKGIRILVEGPLTAPYKNVKKTVELCQKAHAGEIWLLTSSPCTEFPGVSRIFSKVSVDKVPAIYRSCDVIVKLSYVEGMFGPPLEMFHCGGTAIVYDVTGHDEYIIHDHNALVAKRDDEASVVRYLRQLKSDSTLLNRLKEGAKETAKQWIDWRQSSTEFADALETLTPNALSEAEKSSLLASYKNKFHEKIHANMIINGMTQQYVFDAHPVTTGYYAVSVAIFRGQSKINLVFGKNYKHFILAQPTFQRLQDSDMPIQSQFGSNHTRQNPTQIIESLSQDAALIIDITIPFSSPENNQKACCVLQVIFRPIVLQDNVMQPILESQ